MTKFPWSDKEGLRVHFDEPTGRQKQILCSQGLLTTALNPG